MSIPKLILAAILWFGAGISSLVAFISFIDYIADGITLFTNPDKILGTSFVCMVVFGAVSIYTGFKSIGEGH